MLCAGQAPPEVQNLKKRYRVTSVDAYLISVVTCFVHLGYCTRWLLRLLYALTGIYDIYVLDIYLHILRKYFLCATYTLNFKEDLPQSHRALSTGSVGQVCDG